MGGIFPGQGAALLQNRLTPVVWTVDQLDELSTAAHAAQWPAGSLPIHLEINTGMNRQGVDPERLSEILEGIAADSVFWLEAVTTHLYASDESDGRTTANQLGLLKQAFELIRSHPSENANYPDWLSVGASAAILGADMDAILHLPLSNMPIPLVRPGLALYGVVPRSEPPAEPSPLAALGPVLTWKSRVVSVRDVPAGAEVGYNSTFVATEPMRLALIAAGYADGLNRRLGNRFSLLVRGERAPIVGRISMDQAVLDITEIPGVIAGDEVVIIGTQGAETITAYDHADAAGTIPWEIFTQIGSRVARIAV
jgi:alanine racemase